MRGFGMLLLILLGVAVVYSVYWVNRAEGVAKDAAHVVNKGGSISEAIGFVINNQRVPDLLRLSAAQQDYLDRHAVLFYSENERNIQELAVSNVHKICIEKSIAFNLDNPQIMDECQVQAKMICLRLAKIWCEEKGIK
jgi:hypothetical protein